MHILHVPSLIFSHFSASTCTIGTLPDNLSSITENCAAGDVITFGEDSCVYQCASGYDLSVITPVTCVSNETLSSSLPICTGMKSIN